MPGYTWKRCIPAVAALGLLVPACEESPTEAVAPAPVVLRPTLISHVDAANTMSAVDAETGIEYVLNIADRAIYMPGKKINLTNEQTQTAASVFQNIVQSDFMAPQLENAIPDGCPVSHAPGATCEVANREFSGGQSPAPLTLVSRSVGHESAKQVNHLIGYAERFDNLFPPSAPTGPTGGKRIEFYEQDICSDIVNARIPQVQNYRSARHAFFATFLGAAVGEVVGGIVMAYLPTGSGVAAAFDLKAADVMFGGIYIGYMTAMWNTYNCGANASSIAAGPVIRMTPYTMYQTLNGAGEGYVYLSCFTDYVEMSFNGGVTFYRFQVQVCTFI